MSQSRWIQMIALIILIAVMVASATAAVVV